MAISRRDLLKAATVTAGAAALAAGAPTAYAEGTTAPVRHPYRVGRWLPQDQRVLDQWLAELVEKVDQTTEPLRPVMQELQDLIESDPTLYMYFHMMFEQVPDHPPYNRTPTGSPQVRNYRHMIQLINRILGTAPDFNRSGFVGFPINTILDWSMGTPAGIAAFLDERVNAQFKKILNEWGVFLKSPVSRYVLSTDPKHGWFGRDALQHTPDFADTFVCDPTAPFYGFASWDAFFDREFRPGLRPVSAPDDDSVIVSACESAPYMIQHNVKRVDTFWLKGQPYSLRHIFDDDPVNESFVGGTIYQAYLSAESYHRWHSPVGGRIVSVRYIDGSYYAQSPAVGFDPLSPNESQGFITETAARAVIVIEADNPKIGQMALVPVGMAEVSSNEVTVTPGQHVAKGDQIGMFHYGGSTHLLVLGPGVNLTFDLHGQKPGLTAKNIHLGDRLAVVR
ncbi:MAG: phosphatidylserine decarboxylase family protein [Actinomycetes bacterium]